VVAIRPLYDEASPRKYARFTQLGKFIGIFSHSTFFLEANRGKMMDPKLIRERRYMDNIAKPENSAPSGRGRPFAKGNAGRPAGSKNKTTRIAEALLRGEAEQIIRKGIAMAKAGDGPTIRFFAERLLCAFRRS
jgi:hypothetical protein